VQYKQRTKGAFKKELDVAKQNARGDRNI